ncbi:MAG: alpha/beta fold hydrolase, partial [Phycisphaerae bacterium]|nr:alpha/beta fold hydrolase [Phycisphaerae bacterium]
ERDVAALVRRLPEGPVILVGHSLGATIALRVAADTDVRDRIAGVIAFAPYDTVRTPLRTRIAARELPAGPLFSLAMLVLRFRGVGPYSAVAAASRLRCPLLVIHGDSDRIAPPSEGRAIAEAGRGRFELLERVEHADHELREPVRVRDACQGFLASVARGRPPLSNGP